MPMPYLESPFPRPDSTMFGRPAVGSVEAVSGASDLTPLVDGRLAGAALAFRYWAAMTASYGAAYGMPMHVAAVAAKRGRPADLVIPQTDTLRLHHPAPPENPFASLVAHRHLGEATSPLERP